MKHSLECMDELEKVEKNGNEIIFLDFISRCNIDIAFGKDR